MKHLVLYRVRETVQYRVHETVLYRIHKTLSTVQLLNSHQENREIRNTLISEHVNQYMTAYFQAEVQNLIDSH